MAKKISVVIPTYNEEDNVEPISSAVVDVFQTQLPQYQYEIIFIDNCSTDKTELLIEGLCARNPNIRAIFNAKNFGQFKSPYYGMMQADGDAVILLAADFQDPVELIPTFVSEWEQGYHIVSGIKTSSRENKLMYFLRTVYYKMIRKMSDVEQIEHFTGFGLYDQSFIQTMRELDDPTPFLRGIVAELGAKRKDIPYTQAKRRAGKTKNNFFTLFDAGMLSFTSYTKMGLRIATIAGFIFSVLGILIALTFLIYKLVFWDRFAAGTMPILIGVFLFGSIQIFFIGLLGEYIMNINTRVMKRPLVVEDKRVNFNKGPCDQEEENR